MKPFATSIIIILDFIHCSSFKRGGGVVSRDVYMPWDSKKKRRIPWDSKEKKRRIPWDSIRKKKRDSKIGGWDSIPILFGIPKYM